MTTAPTATSFDTDRFRREGRLHVEKGYSTFDYAGSIFSPRDLQLGYETRRQEKLDTVIDYEERFRQYEVKHPGQNHPKRSCIGYRNTRCLM